MADIQEATQIVLVPIGKMGTGKSTFLNAWVQQNFFKTGSGSKAVTKQVTVAPFTRKGETFTRIAVDVPGLLDRGKDDIHLRDIATTLRTQVEGVNVFCLFFQPGGRFDESVERVMFKFDSMFNDSDFYSRLCVIVTRVSTDDRDQAIEEFEHFKRSLQSFIKRVRRWGTDPPNIPFFFTNSRDWDKANWNETIAGQELKKFDEWAFGYKDPLPTRSIREYDPTRKHQETETENGFIEHRNQESIYRTVKGEPIINVIIKTRQKTVQKFGWHKEKRMQTSHHSRGVDFGDIATLGLGRLFRNNTYTVIREVLVDVNGPYTEIIDEPYEERVPSGEFGKSQNIHIGNQVTETLIDRERVKWWGYSQDVSKDTPTYEPWVTIRTYTRVYWTLPNGKKVNSKPK